jgi:hypothetical protein
MLTESDPFGSKFSGIRLSIVKLRIDRQTNVLRELVVLLGGVIQAGNGVPYRIECSLERTASSFAAGPGPIARPRLVHRALATAIAVGAEGLNRTINRYNKFNKIEEVTQVPITGASVKTLVRAYDGFGRCTSAINV